MPKQISKICLDCEKTILKNQKLLTCSQCLQFKHIKCPGRKSQNNPEAKLSANTDWKRSLCDFSFTFASCSKVEFDHIFNPSDSCFDKQDITLNAHDFNLLFINIINGNNQRWSP